MGKKAELPIKESLIELQLIRNSQVTLAKEKRVIALIRIKSNMDSTRQELADYLVVHIRSLERWINTYKSEGIDGLLAVKARRKGSKFITPEIHDELKKRVEDPKQGFLGYWDAQRWIESEYGVLVKYQRVREYLIKHFGTKVKTPRKSHTKKDARAVALFKNGR